VQLERQRDVEQAGALAHALGVGDIPPLLDDPEFRS
jgi:hypothetical protein